MGLFSKLGQSTDLVEGMADRLGIDYGEVVARDPETEGRKFMRAVLNCSKCSNQDGCAKLQAQSDQLATTPDYCRNTDMLHRMQQG
ncbi:hypothetical protein RSK20926_21400 [Roseobacter sp. SK209-2-6]|uniref:DUF6455 family protein n=1 Tax=Roseobacter sp. SK209-2-6 TaxID=388739 RepID=UPI0000F3E828|nr:DUF6455 family protein [Roseobacter sp. SK209-2-6]EBA16324.1 hypothetical protein RSK20926_21400 [Roseobacter sp. SK209-2-6]